jgi:hypothetical protein
VVDTRRLNVSRIWRVVGRWLKRELCLGNYNSANVERLSGGGVLTAAAAVATAAATGAVGDGVVDGVVSRGCEALWWRGRLGAMPGCVGGCRYFRKEVKRRFCL